MHKRGKPQQEIYRPGSGPLRKSNNITEESDADNNISLSSSGNNSKNSYSSLHHHHHHHNETKYRDRDDDNASIVSEQNHVQRKARKPEQKIYVPRAVANARDMPPSDGQHQNGNYDTDRFRPNSKRFAPRRHRPADDFHEDWRPARQGSEPRGPHPSSQRTRDTRSVEPSHITSRNCYDKSYTNKPPTGRRHSTIGLESDKRQNHKLINVDKLPPRFRRKIMEENKLNHPGGGVDDNWNGASLTFQGTSNYAPPNCYPNPMVSQQNYNNSHHHQMGYNTLPHRHRGRGRFLPEYETAVRSKTPDLVGVSSPCNSRPPTPPHGRTRSNDNLYTPRPQSPANYNNRSNNEYRSRNQKERHPPRRNNHYRSNYERNQNQEVHEENWDNLEDDRQTVKPGWESPSPVSPQSPEEKPKLSQTVSVTGNNAILDWSEEVELSERLEAEALSDALTRSSSVTSLVEASSKQPSRHRGSRRKNGRRSGSRHRERSQEGFKVPGEPAKQRRNRRDSSYEKRPPSREASRNRTSSTGEPENWREEIRSRQNSERESGDRSRRNSERDSAEMINVKKAGVLVLPGASVEQHQPRYPEVARKPPQQKSLFDHNNPGKPIIVKSPGSRVSVPGFSDNAEQAPPQLQYTTDQYGNLRPGWYDDNSEGYKSCHYPNLINDIQRADAELEFIMNSGSILINWGTVESLRQFLKDALQYLLCKDLKFCQKVNVEQHLWKTLYHNIIEVTRKAITSDLQNKEQYKVFLLFLIDEGTKYFEGLIESLEETYKFKLNNFLGNNLAHSKGLGYVGLALISVQKLLLFLGDLGRYREQVNETSNYGKCRQWYIKAHEINPKNGKPYNQLAVLAVYSRRKLDAVYYYMRSLMSSNPVNSARECLISLLDENRKKYEQGERKRREERLERAKQHMKQKESEDAENSPHHHQPGSLRHETWIRPDGGRRVHRTTHALHHAPDQKDSEEEDLAALSSVEVNKRFVISYLHVHGKLITKIGMESFHEAAMQMLKEFRALLQHSPVPLPCNRFLQLLALNMFAIESTQLKDPQLQQQTGYRSELQERALVVSLQMFNLILERAVQLLEEAYPADSLSPDVHVLLPAVKIWCDWMLCHSSIWNPPPSTQDFRVGSSTGDIWTRLAKLMTLLCAMEPLTASANLVHEPAEGYEQIRLPEDSVLCGFTPLMVNEPDVVFGPVELDLEFAQLALRITKLLFFGTVFLCGLEPPVLKLEIEDEEEKYVSVVSTSQSRDSPVVIERSGEEVLLERFSDEEEEVEEVAEGGGREGDGVRVDGEGEEVPPKEVRDLISRKVELERAQRRQKLHNLTVQKILSQNVVSVHIEVRPKYLVPDTNCFIDHLDRIAAILAAHVYTLMVPIVVLSELEGLSRGGRTPAPCARRSLTPQHVQKVAQASKKALAFLQSKPACVKCVTTKGAVLSSTTFTTEDDSMLDASFKNDDKILATSLALSKSHGRGGDQPEQEQNEKNEPRKLVSEVVLLTDDRNLRVKALARNVPVRELVDFMQWAGLG